MCGLWFSTTSKIINFSKHNIQRRGPESYNEVFNDLGYFGHALLNTIGEKVEQPVYNNHGYLLYNGSTYNTVSNDNNHIINTLDQHLDNTIEVIKNLIGEYALCYVTEQHIVFCGDQWATKSLWFYINETNKEVAVSSDRQLLIDAFGAAWPAEDNVIYIVNKADFAMQKITNTHWNFDQKTQHYDYVFEAFEHAVKQRHRESDTTYLLSSGYDSGVICCCAQKLFSKIDTVSLGYAENKKVLAGRAQLHRGNILKTHIEQMQQEWNELQTAHNLMLIGGTSSKNFTYIIKQHINKRKNKIIISGVGGDELFSDYGHSSEANRIGRVHSVWPQNLEIFFPWQNAYQTELVHQLLRNDTIAGYFGKEIRTPLLDQKLFQTWLNTSVQLKNAGYKNWMTKYMEIHSYPYANEKIGFDEN